MNYKNILLIGGTHGNEKTGIDLVNYFTGHPVSHIKPMMANELAVKKNVRFIETDLNRSVGKAAPPSHEEALVKQLKNLITKSELTIEFHNTSAKNNTCGIVTTKPNKLHFALASHFGLRRILVMPAGGSLSGLNPTKFFSLEISNTDPVLRNLTMLKTKLVSLNRLHAEKLRQTRVYEYLGITVNKKKLRIMRLHLKDLVNFRAFQTKQSKLLGLPSTKKFYPIFIGEKAYGKDFAFQIVKEQRK